jgi:hypothetical protein
MQGKSCKVERHSESITVALGEKMNSTYGLVKHYPGELTHKVEPLDGAAVCCGIYGVFEHTGIWVDGNIIELKGNGLIRAISPSRFTNGRSGNVIYLACDDNRLPLLDSGSASRAVSRLYEYSDYNIISNNCHKFAWNCVSGSKQRMTSFYDFNTALARHFSTQLSWCPIDIGR